LDSSYIDKLDSAAVKTETATTLSITGETDRIYTPAGGPSTPLAILEGGKKKFEIIRDNLDNAVVWNPWTDKAKSIGDFEPKDGFKQMICVEAGQVKGWVKLEAGETFEGGQIIKALL
jgi:glucose-6-phosphate 1-epimerase